MTPKVSVVMSVYDGEPFLQEAVESVLNQTFADFEFIIIDDGSSDGTWEILESYGDARIRLVRNEENVGLTRSLNKGLTLARGEYIARHDADDVSIRSRFERQVGVLDKQLDVVLVSGNMDLIDGDGEVWHQSRRNASPGLIAWLLLFYNYIGGHGAVMFRRQLAVDLGGYSEEFLYSQDHDLWLRLAEVGDIRIVPDVLVQWRRHDDSISGTRHFEQEAYSVMTSGKAMSRLLGDPLSIDQVVELRAFWLHRFPDVSRIKRLDARLRALYHAFFQSRRLTEADSGVGETIQRAISRRYLTWTRLLLGRLRVFAAISALSHGLGWRAGWHNTAFDDKASQKEKSGRQGS